MYESAITVPKRNKIGTYHDCHLKEKVKNVNDINVKCQWLQCQLTQLISLGFDIQKNIYVTSIFWSVKKVVQAKSRESKSAVKVYKVRRIMQQWPSISIILSYHMMCQPNCQHCIKDIHKWWDPLHQYIDKQDDKHNIWYKYVVSLAILKLDN